MHQLSVFHCAIWFHSAIGSIQFLIHRHPTCTHPWVHAFIPWFNNRSRTTHWSIYDWALAVFSFQMKTMSTLLLFKHSRGWTGFLFSTNLLHKRMLEYIKLWWAWIVCVFELDSKRSSNGILADHSALSPYALLLRSRMSSNLPNRRCYEKRSKNKSSESDTFDRFAFKQIWTCFEIILIF
jgi:hypothetical protein